MNKEFILDFIICKFKICFNDFERQYIDFFGEIYFPYIATPEASDIYFETVLTQHQDGFSVSESMEKSEIQDICNLYNTIHYLVCTNMCLFCNEHNLMVIHASAFRFNQKNILISGVKDSGKTTALLFFLKNGADYLGDEIVVVGPKGMIPYQLPLRAKVRTINYFQEVYNYQFDYLISPDKIIKRKKYLSDNNLFKKIKTEEWIKCDYIIFSSSENGLGGILPINEYQSLKKLLPCIRNRQSIGLCMNLIKNVKCFNRDFDCSLDEMKNIFEK